MWTVKSPEDGPCVGPDPNYRFRYPIGVLPGDVIHDPEKYETIYEPGTILFRIFERIIPFIMGALVILFFLGTTFYMGFSLLRLFYSDTLKPYKTRSLRVLGKHHHHYRHRESGESFSQQTPGYSSLASTQSKWSKAKGKGSRTSMDILDYSDKGDAGSTNKRDLVHPLDSKISLTSPPHRTLPPGQKTDEYPPVVDMLDRSPGNLPMLTKFPPDRMENLFVKEGGRGRLSEVRMQQNRRGDLWTWNPEWYQQQLQDENTTGGALEELQSTHSLLHVKVNANIPPIRKSSLPNLTRPTGEGTTRGLVEKQPPLKEKREELESGAGKEQDKARAPLKVPPSSLEPTASRPVSGDRPLTPITRAELFERYTIRPETARASKFHTAIPKVENKKWNEQFMILRGGPRRNAEEIRKQRKSSNDAGQPPQDG